VATRRDEWKSIEFITTVLQLESILSVDVCGRGQLGITERPCGELPDGQHEKLGVNICMMFSMLMMCIHTC